MRAIEIRNLSFNYPGNQYSTLSEFSWTVEQGDFWVIVGSNGSGKTSLVRLLLGLELPTRGDIHILGNPLLKRRKFFACAKEQAVRTKIGHVPQHLQFDRRLPILVQEVIEGGVLNYSFFRGLGEKLPYKQRVEICMDALSQVQMQDWAKERFSSLSGGQKQRVLIARALATRAPILILDEPTASVDPNAAHSIVQICERLQKKHTILFISHDISMIPQTCEHILCLSSAPLRSEELPDSLVGKTITHTHDVQNMSREEVLFLLYNHWGLNWSVQKTAEMSSRVRN